MMGEAVNDISRLFLDTAPVIYYVEQNPVYQEKVDYIFDQIDQGNLIAVTSPITVAECLVFPKRTNDRRLQQDFIDLLVTGAYTQFVTIGEEAGIKAASLRVQYNLSLMDALQIAVALVANCDAFLTNDLQLRRVSDLRILTLETL
jgi:predicted nucleic acid-binding protein